MKKRIAVTGGIASGKSTAIEYIKKLGYPVFSCDEVYKKIISQEEYIRKIVEFFPECIKEGEIDRKLLSKVVFNSPEKLKILNGIAHPFIMKELYRQMDECSSTCVFAEVPLLFEGNYEKDFDAIIAIKRSRGNRITDIIKRDRISKEDAEKRINAQFDYDSKTAENRLKKCNAVVIENEGDLSALQESLKRVVLKILTDS